MVPHFTGLQKVKNMGYQVLNGHLNPRLKCVPLRADESPELVYVRVEDGLEFAFDPNSMALLKIDSLADFRKLRESPPSPYIMAKYKPHFEKSPAPGPTFRTIVLEACHDCNLACSYCFVRNYYADHGTGNYMTFETARSAIDRLLNPKLGMSVGFFGGEPMLNMTLLRDVTAYVEGLCAKHAPTCKTCGGSGHNRGEKCQPCKGTGRQVPSLSVTTNGTLYSEENLRFLDEHRFSMITSIDGTSEAHDALRPMKRSGKGSHKQILLGLERMKKLTPGRCKHNTLRSTFSALRGETIRTRVEFLNQLCDDGMASWVSVEPAAMSENTCFIPNQDELEIHIGNVWDRFYPEYLDTADWWIERAKAGKQPRFHNFHKSLERIFWCVHSGTECGAGAGYGSVNAKGEIFGCHRESNSYLGTLVTGIDPKLRQPWLDNRIYNRTGCMNCGHRYACGGGCREDSLGDKGNIHEPSNVHCALKDMWVRGAMKIMASLPKDLIAKFCPEPNRGSGSPDRKVQPFISPEQLSRDESGIIRPQWWNNIPAVALVKEGVSPVDGISFRDQPNDEFVSTYQSLTSALDSVLQSTP